jgi:hypothetical protein
MFQIPTTKPDAGHSSTDLPEVPGRNFRGSITDQSSWGCFALIKT